MSMAKNSDLIGEAERAEAADETNQRLREAGFPETAITTWWMLLVDATFAKTAHQLWDSGDFVSLGGLVDKTLENKAEYLSVIEDLASKHWAEQLALRPDVQHRLLGAEF
jgi:hypothetical protein